MAIICLVFIGWITLICIFGPLLTGYSYEQTSNEQLAAPSISHWFGTDLHGRDLLTRILYGGRISLAVGLIGTLVSLTVGVAYGMIAAFILMLGSIFMITMIMSLRIVVPLYALRKRLKDFADGKSGLRLNLRNKDEFQTLEETFNLAMENHDLRQRHLRENIGRVNEHLKNGEADAAKELLRELQRELPERHFIL